MKLRCLGVGYPPSVRRGGQRPLASERGITILEVSVLLIVTTALTAALSPVLAATIRNARTTDALIDMARINVAINNFKLAAFTRFTQDGAVGGVTMLFLYSDGDIPGVGSSANWTALADPSPPTGAYDQGFLEDHLVLNLFNGASYPLAGGTIWRGAYMNAPIDPDPWGNRYGVNVQFMGPSTNDVVVHSAGPDEEVDTPDTGNPLNAVDDDLVVIVEP